MLSLLKKLCSLYAVSGEEYTEYESLKKYLEPLGETTITPLGSILCTLPCENSNAPHIMLEAHLDRIGFQVTNITDEGFLKITNCGGIDIRATAGARVTVHTKNKKLSGIICSLPKETEGKKFPLKTNELAVDVGLTKDEAESFVDLGDRISINGDLKELLDDRVCGAALDNRAGCASVIKAGELLKGFNDVKVTLALCSQEEVGGNGSKTAAYLLKPDYAIAVDVSFAMTPSEKSDDCGKLDDGPMIGYAPTLNRDFSKYLVEIAKKEKICYQTEIMSSRTGTDADSINCSGNGVKTALISIPLRYMHTPSEVVSLTDIKNTAKLMAFAVRGGLC